ncbi:hypothetical protein OJAV_G00055490 [Oryzias javanicus]|uniref:Uncharacterized protein n=1 Tax=Oryzias javanicus TaxID=123683 RepID=A0A3S2N1R9_ORYJA|nr:hypothetical protein OJAV_G00055490 [Oryzias javanicus]
MRCKSWLSACFCAGLNLAQGPPPSSCLHSSSEERLKHAQRMRMHTLESVPSASYPRGISQVLGTLSPQLCNNSTACWDQPGRANC